MKYTMDDFIKNRIAVKVNPGNINLFLDMCEKSGLLWGDGKKATEHVPDHASYIFYDFPGKAKSLAYARDDIGEFALEIEKFKKIDFADIAHINRYQIIIDCAGDTTTARMVINGKEVKTAQAKRNPADKFNWKLAADLAFGRLLGEKKAVEPKKKPGVFKVGDRVVCIEAECGNVHIIKKHGRVIFDDKSDNLNLLVEFDVPILGHSGDGRGNPNHCFWINGKKLRHE